MAKISSQQRQRQPLASRVLLVSLAVASFTTSSLAYPYIVINNAKKCMTYEHPHDTQMLLKYEVLGATDKDIKDQPMNLAIKGQHEIDPYYYDYEDQHENETYEPIEKAKGTIEINALHGGQREICIHSKSIGRGSFGGPLLMSLKVEESPLNDKTRKDSKKEMNQNMAKEHLSYLERSIYSMMKSSELLLRNADLMEHDESMFHAKSQEMNSAAKWWPILHLCVLLVTGYTQANHIVGFFKTRHII